MNHYGRTQWSHFERVERRGMFAGGITIENIAAEVRADDDLAKAAPTTDPVLAAGCRKIARNVRRLQ